jgi:hypothetical protein
MITGYSRLEALIKLIAMLVVADTFGSLVRSFLSLALASLTLTSRPRYVGG